MQIYDAVVELRRERARWTAKPPEYLYLGQREHAYLIEEFARCTNRFTFERGFMIYCGLIVIETTEKTHLRLS